MIATYLDLKGCHNMLEQRLGQRVPSYVTMRRWASDGAFKAIEDTTSKGRRVRYHTAEMLKLVRARLVAKTAKPAPQRRPIASKTTVVAAATPELSQPLELGYLEDMLRAMSERQARVEAMLEESITVSKGLDAIRKLLMLKYEGAHSANLELINQLKTRLRNAEDIQSDMKITISLNRMADRISDLERELRRRG